MKQIMCCLFALVHLLLPFFSGPAGVEPAMAQVEIINHMMTRNPQWDTGCSTPIPAASFDYTDAEANCWFSWDNAPAADEIVCHWYTPDGELYTEQKSLTTYTSGCWYSRILISGHAPEKVPGEWHVEVYFAGVLKFTERFTLHGDPSADQCPAELLYGEYSEETELLRHLRDTFLRQSPAGRKINALYYRYSPAIVRTLRDNEDLKQEVKLMADAVLSLIQQAEKREDQE